MPALAERPRALVVGLGGVEVEVQPRRLVDELELRQRRRTALLAEGREVALQRLVQFAVALAELVPAGSVARRVAGEDRRQRRVLQLERVAGDDPHPWPARGEHGREADHVVLDDHVRLELREDLGQPLVDVASAVDELLPDGEHEGLELLDRRLAELGRGVADEVLPELARASSTSGAGLRRISASSKPCASSVPANDSSTTNTTRSPRSSRTRPIPTQLLVGPNAPSGKKT